jgi:hypothetical protein
MDMPRLNTGLAVVVTLAIAAVSLLVPAKAEIQYPWCAEYSGEDGNGGSNCGFTTLAQCRATISGIGGTCHENPAYRPATQPKKPEKPVRHR